jgi:type VI secretion system secreted protein VgrG
MALTQANSVAQLSTPLGEDVLILTGFSASEGLGELFTFEIEAISERENIDFDPAIGQNCQVKLKTYDDKIRIFNGVMVHARWTGSTTGGVMANIYSYTIVLRPWFWLLDHRADCRIFLEMNVKDIVTQVFTTAGFTDYDDRTTGDYDTIEYCVQYRETDLAFCSRLMELYGIYYFFEHTDGKHTLVLADSRSSHKTIADLPELPLIPLANRSIREMQRVHDWVSKRWFRTGKVQFNDYDYIQPNKNLLAPKETSEIYAHSKLEVYDYPGKYDDKSKGEKLAQFRLEAEQSFDHRRSASGDAASIFPGGLITLQNNDTPSENREYLVLHAAHGFSTSQYRTDNAGGDEWAYNGHYEFLPSDQPFRMLPVTPKPRVYGIETAKVVGKQGEDGEEISTDEYGRIWVQFFWDREPKKTCPIRVAHVWSSNKWGTQFIPRLGMEVVVDFLEGDPDRPLVTGCVYNGNNKFPYDLPDNKTQSGTKSDSSKGHGGYNEFMFEDKKGSEDIRMHAQKDHDVTVLDTETWTIGQNFTSHKGPASRKDTLVNGDDNLDVQNGNQIVHISKNQEVQVDQCIHVTANQEIILKVGPSTITMNNSGITIKAPEITIKSTANMDIEAGATMTIKAALVQIN